MADPRCTGLTAAWCPVHGDCTCPRNEDGEPLTFEQGGYDLDAPDCPLHCALASDHVTVPLARNYNIPAA